LGDAIDYFEYKAKKLIETIAIKTGVSLKQEMIFHHYRADHVSTLEWGYLL
jgi:hypothetical protein